MTLQKIKRVLRIVATLAAVALVLIEKFEDSGKRRVTSDE
jgi:hypothetical protein